MTESVEPYHRTPRTQIEAGLHLAAWDKRLKPLRALWLDFTIVLFAAFVLWGIYVVM